MKYLKRHYGGKVVFEKASSTLCHEINFFTQKRRDMENHFKKGNKKSHCKTMCIVVGRLYLKRHIPCYKIFLYRKRHFPHYNLKLYFLHKKKKT